MKFVIGKRYIFVTANDTTYSGNVLEVNNAHITTNQCSDEDHQEEGAHDTPRHLIRKAFRIDDFIVGNRYTFVTSNKLFNGNFISVTGSYERIHLDHFDIQYPKSIVSFPIYWIKDIQIME